MGVCLTYLRDSKEASMAGAERAARSEQKRKIGRGQGLDQMGICWSFPVTGSLYSYPITLSKGSPVCVCARACMRM